MLLVSWRGARLPALLPRSYARARTCAPRGRGVGHSGSPPPPPPRAKRRRGVRGAAPSEEGRALPDDRLARKPPVLGFRAGHLAALLPRSHARARTCAPRGRGVGLSGSPRSGGVGRGAQPRLKKVAPCQTTASPGNRRCWGFGQAIWRRCCLGHMPGRAHARPAAAAWGSRGPREAAAWGAGRSPV